LCSIDINLLFLGIVINVFCCAELCMFLPGFMC